MELELENLVAFLYDHFPKDVPIPCRKQTKRPLYRHAGGSWGWTDFDATRKLKNVDIGILLHDLCVVDVDTVEDAVELAGRFPELHDAPCERTSRGYHFFFRRSPLADAHGFFDGPGQVVKGVDFKSRCSNGTSGLVLVAPSTGKTWMRPPWIFHPPVISDTLLVAIAKPKRRMIRVTCYDGSSYVCSSFMERCGLVIDMMSDHLFESSITLPSISVFDLCNLVRLVDHQMIPEFPSADIIERALDVADMLDAPCPKTLEFGGCVRSIMDVAAKYPSVAHAMHAEMAFRKGLRPPPDVSDAYIPDAVCVDPGELLFTKSRRPHVFRPESGVPACVDHILRTFPNRVVLAGGGACASVLQDFPASDYDLFLMSVSEDVAISIVNHIATMHTPVYVTTSAVTLLAQDGTRLQIILRRYVDVASLLSSFDIAPAKIAVWYCGGDLAVKTTETWRWSIANSMFVVAVDTWGVPSFSRIVKYARRGFAVYVPCVDPRNVPASKIRDGIGRLFTIDSLYDISDPRSIARAMAHMARGRSFSSESDYSVYKRISSGFFYWCRWIARRLVFYRPNVTGLKVPVASHNGNFRPTSAKWHFVRCAMNRDPEREVVSSDPRLLRLLRS